jgi:hypothetical protein
MVVVGSLVKPGCHQPPVRTAATQPRNARFSVQRKSLILRAPILGEIVVVEPRNVRFSSLPKLLISGSAGLARPARPRSAAPATGHQSSIVSLTRCVIVAGASSRANVTVRSKPCGPVMSTWTPPREWSAAIQASYAARGAIRRRQPPPRCPPAGRPPLFRNGGRRAHGRLRQRRRRRGPALRPPRCRSLSRRLRPASRLPRRDRRL